MLSINEKEAMGQKLAAVLPQIGAVFDKGREAGRKVYREQVTFYRSGAERTFNIQLTTEESPVS